VEKKCLKDWLTEIQAVHAFDMDLSLERVYEVATRLNIIKPTCYVITVAGTNGKGSCVAGLEAIYLNAGLRVGVFTSPILFRHNEYIRINGKDATDDQFCEAFTHIDKARGDITLTPFEFNALAAFYLFDQLPLDVWILEVGLGGRFDAVNVIDADLAIVASIDLDHMEWLGDTREKIAYEKAGVFRANKPAICGDDNPPHSLISYAKEQHVFLYCQAKDYGFEKNKNNWSWWSQKEGKKKQLDDLPLPHLALQNMATVLMAVELLQNKLPVTVDVIKQSLNQIKLLGRIQVIPGSVEKIFDVAHNPAAAQFLSTWLIEHPCQGKTRAVFSMLSDKDILSTLQVIKSQIESWYIASLPVKRGAALKTIEDNFQLLKIDNVHSYTSLAEAYAAVMEQSQAGDRVVIFGSFHTVSEIFKAQQLL